MQVISQQPTQKTDEAERRRRQQVNRDSRTSVTLGISYEAAVARREKDAAEWLTWMKATMAELGADGPEEILHLICQRVEMKSAETACAVAKIVAKQTVQQMLAKVCK